MKINKNKFKEGEIVNIGVLSFWVGKHGKPMKLARKKDMQCDICGDHHEGNVPRECETGDGV